MVKILVDGDACPVKDEVYVVATRYGLRVALVANARMHVPSGFGVEMIVVDGTPDAADDWIVEHVDPAAEARLHRPAHHIAPRSHRHHHAGQRSGQHHRLVSRRGRPCQHVLTVAHEDGRVFRPFADLLEAQRVDEKGPCGSEVWDRQTKMMDAVGAGADGCHLSAPLVLDEWCDGELGPFQEVDK